MSKIIASEKFPVPVEDLETLIADKLGEHHMWVERRTDERGRLIHLDFRQYWLDLMRYYGPNDELPDSYMDRRPRPPELRGGRPVPCVVWGAAEIRAYSDGTEIRRMWASNPKAWLTGFVSDDLFDAIQLDWWQQLGELSDEIKEHFAASTQGVKPGSAQQPERPGQEPSRNVTNINVAGNFDGTMVVGDGNAVQTKESDTDSIKPSRPTEG